MVDGGADTGLDGVFTVAYSDEKVNFVLSRAALIIFLACPLRHMLDTVRPCCQFDLTFNQFSIYFSF